MTTLPISYGELMLLLGVVLLSVGFVVALVVLGFAINRWTWGFSGGVQVAANVAFLVITVWAIVTMVWLATATGRTP